MGIKRGYKFNWIKSKCWTSPDTKKNTPAGKRHACCLLDMLQCEKLEQRQKRRFLIVQRDNTAAELNFPEGQIDNRSSGTRQKVENWKAHSFTLRKQIAELKSVTSDVKPVLIHPKSMAPCRGHHGNHTRQEMDHHWSDPLGTESPHMRFDQNQWPKVDLLEVVSKWIKYTLSSGFSA